MGYLDNLPTFPIVEINTSTGLRAGHVLSQYSIASSGITLNTTYTNDFLENGAILGLNASLEVVDYLASTCTQPFLHYTEELNTLQDALKYFAVEEDADGEIRPRLIGLYVGDTFTTDRFTGTGAAGVWATGDVYARVTNGKLVLQQAKDLNTMFAVELSTTPLGEEAVKVTYLGIDNELRFAAHA